MQVNRIGALLKKYTQPDGEGCKIEDLNKELRSKYTVDLNAPAHEIVYMGVMRNVSEGSPNSPPTAPPKVPSLQLHASQISLADHQTEITGAATARLTRALPGSDMRPATARTTHTPSAEVPATATPSEFDGYTRSDGDHATGGREKISFIDRIIANAPANTHYLEQGYQIAKINARPQARTASLPISSYGPEGLSRRYMLICRGS